LDDYGVSCLAISMHSYMHYGWKNLFHVFDVSKKITKNNTLRIVQSVQENRDKWPKNADVTSQNTQLARDKYIINVHLAHNDKLIRT